MRSISLPLVLALLLVLPLALAQANYSRSGPATYTGPITCGQHMVHIDIFADATGWHSVLNRWGSGVCFDSVWPGTCTGDMVTLLTCTGDFGAAFTLREGHWYDEDFGSWGHLSGYLI